MNIGISLYTLLEVPVAFWAFIKFGIYLKPKVPLREVITFNPEPIYLRPPKSTYSGLFKDYVVNIICIYRKLAPKTCTQESLTSLSRLLIHDTFNCYDRYITILVKSLETNHI